MDKKNKIKSGFIFGTLMTIVFIGKALLIEDNLTTKHIAVIIASGIVGGCIAGLLFGWLIGKFGNSKSVMRSTKIHLDGDETVLFETFADYFKGIEAVGGKLYLTDKRLVFQSHKFNFQNHQLSIPLFNIAKVSRYRVLGIANTGFCITTVDSKPEKFVVRQPSE